MVCTHILFKIVIKSICLTIEVQRWYPSSTTIFIAGDKTTLDEKDEESYHRTTEEGPPVLEVEHMPSWRRTMPPFGIKDRWSTKDHHGTPCHCNRYTPS
jgi:hypothetical protein